ncbi:MAG: hypothetical protein RPU43_11980 [Candidatus Sedimenticola sp. (ex Thyasira tokunagai)]
MNQVVKFITVALLAITITGCSSVETKKTPAKLAHATFINSVNDEASVFLKEQVKIQYKQGMGMFINTMYFTLLSGEYAHVANGNGGSYYQHVKSGLQLKNLGITEHRIGGFFKPNNVSDAWYVWAMPNTVFAIGSIIVHTGVKDGDVVHYTKIAAFSDKLNEN